MNSKDKRLIEGLILLIEDGQFDFHHVTSILMHLRDVSGKLGYKRFNEVANFIAHPQRDKGIIANTIEYSALILRFNLGGPATRNKQIDVNGFPIYIKRLLYLGLEKMSKIELRKINCKRDVVKATLDKIEIDEIRKVAYFPISQHSFLTKEFKEFMNESLSIMKFDYIYNQISFIKDFKEILKQCGLKYSDHKFTLQGDKITVCILYLLHDSVFKSNFSENGKITISTGSDKLEIHGNIEFVQDETKIPVAFPVFMSNLDTHKYFSYDPSLQDIDFDTKNLLLRGNIPN
ncbi:hypothetical protein [[Flexibacter] sp. ATCC 35208]|uniref:hypothetical protein n=1 Tax=[Flexibacter] sp. ATCC 35208 TaxID=1936242 RepID=UPI00117F586E|nr:hypothetical protein [[Flexibacter] sp. ATCC 35208]